MATKTRNDNAGADGRTRFASKYPRLRICLEKPVCEAIPGGRFRWGGGKRIEFHNGTYATSDPAEVAALRRCKSYGSMFQEIDAGKLQSA